MADYSIELGVKLRTSDIDTQINKYSNKDKLIKVKADLDASDITKTLNSFKGKSIDVNTKLSTKGITEAIRAYTAPKKIHLESDLSTVGIDNKISNYVPSKTINVDVELNKKSISRQIQMANPSEHIVVKAKLDDDAITEAINSYKTVKPIPIKIKPDFSELNFDKVEELLKGYEARTPLKVNAQLNKTAINNVISEFNTELKGDRNRDILLQVKLTDGAVAEAVSKYKASDKDKLKIPLDLDLKTSTEFDTKIKQKRAEYEKDPILIPAKLIQASKGFSSAIQKTPISIEATLKNPQEISNEINKYIEKPVPVKAQLVPTKGFDSNITKTPIKVHATLLPEEINSAITNFKPSSKINVGVKLNPADINTEVSKLPKPTQPLEVDVNLTKASVNKAITNTKATSLLKVGIDLQTEDINAQIEKINPTSKVNVRLDLGDNINEEVKKQSSQVPIDVNVRLDREDINKQIREFKTNTKFKVGVKLDFASHQGGQKGVPQQIKDYKTNTKIKVGVEIDRNSANQAVQGLTVSSPVPIRIELEPNSVQNVNNQIDNIRRQIEELGNIRIDFGGNTRGRSIGATAGAYQRAYREVYNIHKQIESMELKLGSLDMSGVDYSNISQYRAQLDSLRQTYQTLLNTLNGDDINLDAVFNDIDQARTMIAGLLDSVDNARTKLAKDIKLDIDSGSLQSKVDAVAQKFDKLGVENRAVANDITELQRLLSNMDRSDDIESITSDYQTFLQLLKTVKSAVNDLQMEMDAANRPEILEAKRVEAAQKLNGLFEEGSQASRVFGQKAEELRRELNNVGNVKGIDIVNKKIKNLGTEIKNSKLQTQTLGSRLKEQFSRYSNYLSIASVFMYGTQAMRSMFEQVKLIDSAMTELKKVTDETDASYNNFLNNAASKAKEIGTTIDGLIKSTADFARLGYGFEDSQGLAEVANIYAVVGDEIEGVEDATESLISTMAAFKDSANGLSNTDFAMSIIDKYNEIGNKFAISSGGIGEALKRSASSLDAANNSIDESIALITAANTVVQNPDKVGNAFKTISMRIRAAKTELEEAGESTEGMAESTATMRREIMALSGVDIMASATEFKSTYQVMDELSKKWKDLTDIQQASIIELMAGKHQGNVFSSLMQNFDIARDALKVSAESAGSAMQEHAKWSESLEARLLKLKATWQSFAQTFMDSNLLKGVIDAFISLVDILDKLIKSFGTLGSVGFSVGLFNVIKYAKSFETFKIFSALTPDVRSFKGVFQGLMQDFKKFSKTPAGVATSIGLVTAAVGLAYSAIKNYKEEQSRLRQEHIETANSFLDSVDSFEQAYIKYSGRTDLTAEEESELESAIQGTVNVLNDKSSALQGVVNSSSDYIKSIEAIKDAELKEAASKANVKKDKAASELEYTSSGWFKFDGSEVDIEINTEEAQAVAEKLGEEYYGLLNTFREEAKGDTYGFTLDKNADADDILDYYYTLVKYRDELSNSGLGDTSDFETVNNVIEKMSDSVNTYVDAIYDAAKAQYQLYNGIPKTAEEYMRMRESIIQGMGDASFDKKIDIAGRLDSEYSKYFDLSSVEIQAKKFADIIEGYDVDTVETFLNMKTMVNDNECTVDRYLSELDNVISMSEKFGDAEKEEFNLAFGIDTDRIKSQYDDLMTKLTDDHYKIGMSDSGAKTFLDGLTAGQLTASRDLFSSNNEEFRSVLKNYQDILNEAEQSSVDFSKTVYGNVNTNARQVLEWTSENLQKYKDNIMSWEAKDASWDDVKKYYEGTISTVDAVLSSYEIGEKQIDFAITPLLQTDNGAEYLSSGTVDAYMDELISKATEDGKWDNAELFALDAAGLEIDGQKVKGILADIGDTAEATSMQMHFVGKDGALALAEEELFNIIKAQEKLNEAMVFTIDVKANKESLDALNTALSESKSAAGLTAESIESLKSRYQDLDGYDAASLFEETASGIRVNSTELAKLEKEYKDFNKQEIDETLKTLTDEYNNLTDEIANCADDQEKLNELYNKRSDILDQINNVASLAAQYEGLTSAYNEWLRAKEAGQDRDPYENVLSGREEIEEEMSRGWLDDAAVEYLELLSGKDLSAEGIDAQIAAYKELDNTIGNTKYSVWDFFTKDKDGNSTSDGVYNFFDTVKSVAGETAAWIDENGKYNFNFEGFEHNGKTGDAAIAEILGTSEELVQILLRAAEDAGFIVNIEGDYTDLADAVNEAEKANDRMKELGATTYTFNFDTKNIDSLNEQIGEAKTMLSNLKNEDGTLKVGVSEEDYRQARDIMYSLILQKQRLDDSAVLHVNTEQAESDIELAILKLQEFKTYANTLEVKTAVEADTSEVTSNIQSVLDEINGLDANIKAGLGLDTTEVQTAINNVQANIDAGVTINQADLDVINATISSISNDAMVSLGLDTTLIDNYKSVEQEANGVVNWDNNIEKVTTWINQKHEASGTVKWDDDTTNLKTTYTGKGIVYWDTEQANGTANANGTAQSGRSFAKGDWGIKGSGTALVGELGTEVLVRNGQYYTIGDNGAEFIKYRQGDIIFNHRQTEELFKNGKVTSGGGRGKMFANGSAFALGTVLNGSSGGGNFGGLKNVITDAINESNNSSTGSSGSGGSGRNTIKDAVKTSSSNKSSSKSKSSSSSAEEAKEFEETIDWIEVAISRIEREIDNLDKKASNVYESWSERNSALTSQISEVGSEIELQQKAYDRYMQEANSVGLSEAYASKVRDGTIDIETITDEALKEKVDDYKQWYEKALDCKDAILDLKESESELYKQRFDNVSAQYDGILGVIEHEKNMLEEYINQSEAQAWLVSGEYYNALANNERGNIDQLEKQKASMLAELQKAMESETIVKGSEAW